MTAEQEREARPLTPIERDALWAALRHSTRLVELLPMPSRFDADGFDHHAPCPICKGVEGCSHSVGERKRAHLTTAGDG